MSKQPYFCMVGGIGETSYANNSFYQRSIINKVKPLVEESIRAVYCNISPEFLSIADLGCSSGPNTLAFLQSIISVVVSTSQSSGLRIPEFNFSLNDLPHNDFNTIFKSLPSFYREIEEKNGVEIPCFVSGTPSSFYGRLFPRNLMHFMHSSSSLHWLSQAPKGLMGEDGKEALNKGCIYARKQSPPQVLKAYRDQFAEDFGMFLRCRSEEVVHGGRIVLSFLVSHDDEAYTPFELTNVALYKLASEGRIEKRKLDEFNLQFYRPTVEQVKQLIEAEESLALHKLDTFTASWVAAVRDQPGNRDIQDPSTMAAKSVTRAFRAVMEPVFATEFGEEIMDDFFGLFQAMLLKNIAMGEEIDLPILAVSLMRKL